MFCTSCGAQMPDDSRFCGNCGSVVSQSQTPSADQTAVSEKAGGVATPSRAQYVPPGARYPGPPVKPDRTVLWVALAIVGVVVIAAAIAIPLLLRGEGDNGETALTGTSFEGSTTVSTAAPGTTATSQPPATTSPSVTEPPTTATTAPPDDGPAGWGEVEVPGGPWTANEVAVSDDAVLLSTPTGTGVRLVAVMLGSGNVIELTESDAAGGIDIHGTVAVWWEADNWDDAAQRWTEQHIYSFHLPDGPRTEITDGGGARIGWPQVAVPWLTWVESAPWPPNPEEMWSERIMLVRVDDNGVPTGAPIEQVPLALASVLGDSGWAYSLSRTCLAWENMSADAGYDEGAHVDELDTSDHAFLGPGAWRPSVWQHTVVYSDGGLKRQDLSVGGTDDFAAEGDFPTAGPDFAAFYRLTDSGSDIVVRAYDGSYEQVLGTNPDPPWFCPPISVSEHYVAFIIAGEVHLLRFG
jgi:hypothetical protein